MTQPEAKSLLAVQAAVLRQIYYTGGAAINSWQLVVRGLLTFHIDLCEELYEYVLKSLDELHAVVMSNELDVAEPDDYVATGTPQGIRDTLHAQYDELTELFGLVVYLVEHVHPEDVRRTLTRETVLDRFRQGGDGLRTSFVRLKWFPEEAKTDRWPEQVVVRRTEVIVNELCGRLFEGTAEIHVQALPARLANIRAVRAEEAEQRNQLLVRKHQRARVEAYRPRAASDDEEIPF